jgi:hypothetical protein
MLTNNSRTDLMSYFYRQVVSKSPVKATRSMAYENGWNAINQLVRGDYSWAGPEPNVFYARRGKRFYDFSGISGIDLAEDSRAFALFDLDGDGCLDLAVKSRMGPQLRVFRNSCGQARERIVVRLRGTKSNHDAVGARVEVDGQVKWIVAGSAYLSQHTKRLHFGLGERKRAEKVRIAWPSGLVQELPPLDAGYLYEVTEGLAEFRSERLRPPVELPADVPIRADNRSRLFTTWLREPVPLPEKRRGPALLVLHAGCGALRRRSLRPTPFSAVTCSITGRTLQPRFGCSSIRRAAFAESTKTRRQHPPFRTIGARWRRPSRMRARCRSTASFSASPPATILRSEAPC